MATSSTNPALGPRYGLGRSGPSNSAQHGQNNFSTPAAGVGGFNSTAKTQQRLEAERLERERKAREEKERMEQAGQNSLAELSEEQREEISEAVSHILLSNGSEATLNHRRSRVGREESVDST